ncbi:MAG: hypothetical protein JOY77_07520 [Alphaproteobacteria bacterium]|nr:hypothetical protein [Alphaproteobacteria bacterium]
MLLLASAAALVSSSAFAGHNVSLHASGVKNFSGVKAPSHQVAPKGKGLCGTKFGPELTTPDGLIGWNDTSGTYNTAGASDFKCKKATSVKEVDVYGYNAPANPEQYNVTFYANDKKSNEPNDKGKAVCSYTGLMAEGGGSYPTHVLSHIKLSKACKLKTGTYWVAVQNNDAAGPWYWEMTSQLSGAPADWVDRGNVFGSGCTTFDNGEYLQQCLGYTYPDYMLELH